MFPTTLSIPSWVSSTSFMVCTLLMFIKITPLTFSQLVPTLPAPLLPAFLPLARLLLPSSRALFLPLLLRFRSLLLPRLLLPVPILSFLLLVFPLLVVLHPQFRLLQLRLALQASRPLLLRLRLPPLPHLALSVFLLATIPLRPPFLLPLLLLRLALVLRLRLLARLLPRLLLLQSTVPALLRSTLLLLALLPSRLSTNAHRIHTSAFRDHVSTCHIAHRSTHLLKEFSYCTNDLRQILTTALLPYRIK